MLKHYIMPFCLALAMGTTHLLAQQIDEQYNGKIREYTTDPQFLPSIVLDLPDDPNIPSPLEHFGQIIGAPGVMHHTSEIYAYYEALAKASPLIKVEQIGTTEEGRPIKLVVIGSETSMGRLTHYQQQLARLSDPRKVSSAEAVEIIKDSKPVYYLNGGLHSTEMGSPEMLMELAYRLVAGHSDYIKNILDNVIVLINPASEPDGRDKQVDWYYRYTKSRKEYDDGFPRSTPYWGKYVFHDNNRDGIQVSQALSKAIFKVYYKWHPSVMLDLHESVPLLYISTGTGPYNDYMDPITIGEWQTMANNEITSMAAQGLPGTFTWAFFDGWWPGYAMWVANNHNSIGRFYETFGNAGANTYLRDLSKQKYAGDPATSREWYRPAPPTQEVYWSSRNNTNYMQAGVLASLTYAADNGKLLLHNFYKKGVNAIEKGKTGTPKAFVVPKAQKDPAMVAYLINQLRMQGIEVHETKPGSKEGEYVVLLDQPYRNLAITLLTKQAYPKEAKFPPYDDIAWTLGLLYGVEVKAEDEVKFGANDLKMVTSDVVYKGEVEGNGNTYVLDYKAQNTVLPAMYWVKSQNKKATLSVLDEMQVVGGDTLLPGSVIFKGLTRGQSDKIGSQYQLDLIAVANAPGGKQHEVTLPRVAIYHSWFSTQDEGWSRYTFDERGIPYTSIDKDDLKAGDLRKKFDVILVPRMRGNVGDFIYGVDSKFGPMPFTKTAEYPSHGMPDATNDMTGGPGMEGMGQLKAFIDAGGVVVTLDNSTKMVAETGIARELEPYQASGLFHPGSVVTVKARQSNSPVLYGYPGTFHVFRGNGPLFQVDKYNRGMMVLQYGTKPLKDEIPYTGPVMGMPDRKVEKEKKEEGKKDAPYVLSGMVRNEQAIIGHGGIFNVPQGAGRVIAFTFDPLHRYLNHHDAPLVWNVLINWDHLGNP
ncbi:MAG: peptidase [Cyclobacteriaceae bacterium]|nr:peptidase [Cyclobacteriaceae bacterium]MCB0499706.1 peptidase [Cyclobacteriaceae bacterium]MCB9238514.1 peptidase [Flammeovirgaceae bacterium]MCO5272851.1 peptidase [Cyclobacteriaceae bacterium]